jgi:hypothetical protein
MGAAVSTAASLVVITCGYALVASRCLGEPLTINPWPMAPVVTGVAIALLTSGAVAAAAGVGGVLLVAIVVQRATGLFGREDQQFLQQLDMPPRLKRIATRGLAIAAR